MDSTWASNTSTCSSSAPACPASGPPSTCTRGARARATSSSKVARRWAAPGISSAIPGIRSDSDMHTLGYSFKPWREAKAIADGPSILDYVKETAAEYGVDRAHPLRAPGDEGRLVERGRHLDRRGAAQGHRRDRPLHLQLPLHVRGLLQLPAGLHARVRGHRALQGHDRPSRSSGRKTSTTRARRSS